MRAASTSTSRNPEGFCASGTSLYNSVGNVLQLTTFLIAAQLQRNDSRSVTGDAKLVDVSPCWLLPVGHASYATAEYHLLLLGRDAFKHRHRRRQLCVSTIGVATNFERLLTPAPAAASYLAARARELLRSTAASGPVATSDGKTAATLHCVDGSRL